MGHRREHTEDAFEAFRKLARTDGITVETEHLYGTDVAETVKEAAAQHSDIAFVFGSRGGCTWLDLVSGNVRSKHISDTDIPDVALPDDGDDA